MKKNFFLFALIPTLILSIIFVSCRKGEKGDPGPAGASSSTPAYKDGSITGLLEGTTITNDSAFSLNLNYQYYKATTDNFVNLVHGESGDYYKYSITRYDETGNSYIKLEFSLDYYDPNVQLRTTDLVPEIYNSRITIVTNKKLSANKLFYFATVSDAGNPFNISDVYLDYFQSGDNSYIQYENIAVNSNTGVLSFDYTLQLSPYYNSTNTLATMTGTVNLTPYNVVYRTGSGE